MHCTLGCMGVVCEGCQTDFQAHNNNPNTHFRVPVMPGWQGHMHALIPQPNFPEPEHSHCSHTVHITPTHTNTHCHAVTRCHRGHQL